MKSLKMQQSNNTQLTNHQQKQQQAQPKILKNPKPRDKNKNAQQQQQSNSSSTQNNQNTFYLTLALVTILSTLTRLYNLHKPNHVCWDETHFGKMASWYLNRTFFFDVHPPLGKMLIAAAGHLSGYDGTFAFHQPGDVFQSFSQYLGMRVFCATLGLLIVPIIFVATKSISKSTISALLAASLILFDNGMITLTRYILLDPILLFFVASSFLGMAKFSFDYGPSRSESEFKSDPSFTKRWWFWLFASGTSIACAFSIKFVGLFCVLLVGFRTIYDLWVILNDTRKPISYFYKHFLARTIVLIVWPIVLYTLFFFVHLQQLTRSGNGDGFYSSAFQTQLIGNSLYNASWPIHLAYGAVVTIKNNRIGGAYLHSHWHLYPEGVGAKQQQVTTYSHKDSNNKWIIKRALNLSSDDIFVHNHDFVILEHYVTKRNLHSHFEQAPITKRHFQVTGYGQDGKGDANDVWQIIKDSPSNLLTNQEDDRIYTVTTKFRLVHVISKCALHSHSKQLPKWAYEQLEVTCNPKLYDKNNYWNIEDNYYPSLPNSSFENFKLSFIDRFIESHAVMFQGNAGLKPKAGEVTSQPWEWPLNYRGQFFSASKEQKIYLLGNPVIWWANIINIPVCLLVIAIISIYKERQTIHSSQSNSTTQKSKKQNSTESPIKSTLALNQDLTVISNTYLEGATWVLIAWVLHYLPFYFMGRILYFHHYFPASIFSCILTAMTVDYTLVTILKFMKLKPSVKVYFSIVMLFLSVVIYVFVKFLPITYGVKSVTIENESNNTISSSEQVTQILTTNQHLSSLKWLDSWEF